MSVLLCYPLLCCSTLSLKVRTLEPIKGSGNDSAENFRNVLKEVLEGKGCFPVTRSHFVDALEAKTVEFPQLAKELRQKYKSTPPGDWHKLTLHVQICFFQ